jgi:ribonucleotide reductase beta subunit family protein with ferritin-like domain
MGFEKKYLTPNPFSFMVLQDVRPLTNFFEKRVTEYSKGFDTSRGAVTFAETF